MPVSHAVRSILTSTDKQQASGLLEVLAQVTDPRRKRGRRFTLVFVLAVAVVCVLAGAKNFREIGDQAGDLPQDLLAAFGGKPHPLLRRITAPGEKRIRTLIQALDAAARDVAVSLLHPGSASPKSTGLSSASPATGPAHCCSFPYDTQVTNDFADPVGEQRRDRVGERLSEA